MFWDNSDFLLLLVTQNLGKIKLLDGTLGFSSLISLNCELVLSAHFNVHPRDSVQMRFGGKGPDSILTQCLEKSSILVLSEINWKSVAHN